MSGSQRELCLWRLAQSRDSLLEARVLHEAGMSKRSVVNRLYYAMFYAVLALLQTRQMGTSKHSGMIALFDREFVKTGQVPREFSKVLHRAFELRQKGDYMEEVEIALADVEEIQPLAEAFVRMAEDVVAKS